ncbi:TetR/AcrR family transcriptional regulator [Paenibacillus arenilitoris]|uniref:TetR/AcrR family transcriptional regulator n=1 Tax=Paenibacillus arenilitoris TaxID=2772299 RepID=A0A927CM82_9BACL|nr:TetR/AcrR family transcriptional regulator [Paenibacillus arenilitoris]MBD2870000.1 TetR/AcrR family transcriptional regulator [Paenibacillus arenilitoris]
MFARYNKVQQAVLETTLRLIIDKELQATSMSLIAKESKVSTGNIYHYFSSKEDIINELYKAIVQFNGEYVTKNWSDADPVRVRFERAWENVIRLGMEYPQGFQFIEQYSFSPYIYEASKLEAYKGGWCGPLEAVYREAIAAGLFKPGLEPRLMVQMHYGSFVYLLKAHLQQYLELNEETIRSAISSSWNAFGTDKAVMT